MARLSLVLLGLLSLSSAAATAPAPEAGAQGCTKFRIQQYGSAKNIKNITVPSNLGKLNVFEDFLVSSGEAIAGGILSQPGSVQTKNGTFGLSAIYCPPTKHVPHRANTIQYLQHAITMRKEYWFGGDYPTGAFDGDHYSWVKVAREKGYHILAVDNLGEGESEHPDPIDVTQQTLQVEVINGLLVRIRKGTVGGPLSNKKFSKIIYAGHSYGSICGNGIATHHPDSVDAFVFTGYSAQFVLGTGPLGRGIPIPARLVHPDFAGLQLGYLADSSVSGRAQFFTEPPHLGGYNKSFVKYDFEHEGTGSIGELATLLYGVGPADQYKGDVFVLTGENDAIVCNVIPGMPDCGQGDNSLPAKSRNFFPNAKSFGYHIPKVTGHFANWHYSAPLSFQIVHAHLAKIGY